MSISSPQEVLRKDPSSSQEKLEPCSSKSCPTRFQKLLKVQPTDERSRGKNFFSLIEEEEEENKSAEAPYSGAPLFLTPHLEASQGIASVHAPDLQAIFEKMASSMILMNTSGEMQTTLVIDNPSSLFFGTQITISEFSTAPKAFNVEIASIPQALEVIDANKSALLAAFQNGRFNFSIHRLDTHLQNEERPVFHRKEGQDSGDKDHRGGRGQ